MNHFSKGGGFKGRGNSSGPQRKSFAHSTPRDGGGFRGGPKRDFSRPLELHKATCANCGKMCEVPFLPNGKKPVYCKDCFTQDRPDTSRTHTQRPPYRPEGTQQHSREDLRPQIEALNTKLDTLMRMVESLKHTASTESETKSPARKAVKKIAKK